MKLESTKAQTSIWKWAKYETKFIKLPYFLAYPIAVLKTIKNRYF